MNIADIRKKNVEELDKELIGLYREQFNLRMQKGSGDLAKPHNVKRVRRQIARIQTIVNEMRHVDE